ncbi:MAG: hypothetical protein U9Q66_01165 [Patescibacteria group bacterium]|nr:hypothetical protein [Patescibacteria group bacterium]
MDSFRDLLNVEELGDKKVNFNDQRGDISYYCKDCKEIVEVERIEPK